MSDLFGTGAPVPGGIDNRPRCRRCKRLLAERVSRPWRIRCDRCKLVNEVGPFPDEPSGLS